MATQRRSLRVAALQLNSATGDVAGNLARATRHVEAAAVSGARLVLLPELYSSGYVYSRSIWEAAERLEDGPTVRWASQQAQRLGVHVCMTLLEARGEHFFNTFVCVAPDGTLPGVVRKQCAPALEAFFVAPGVPSGPGTHVFSCPLLDGLRVAVGICYECQLAYIASYAVAENADLLLMPHSAPRVEMVPKGTQAAYTACLLELPARYATALSIPVVFCNKSGPWTSPFPGMPSVTFRAGFGGGSCIIDAGGKVLAAAGELENTRLVADVSIPPPGAAAASAATRLPALGEQGAFSPLSTLPISLRAMFAIDAAIGSVFYRLSRRRRAAALSVSRGDEGGPERVRLPPLFTPRGAAGGALVGAAVGVLALTVGAARRRGKAQCA